MMSDRLRSRMRDKSNTYCPVCEVAFQSRREFVHHGIIEHDLKVKFGTSGVRLNREKLLKKMKEDQSEGLDYDFSTNNDDFSTMKFSTIF